MASIQKRTNGSFRAMWRDPLGKQRSKSFPKERAARVYLAEVTHTLHRGTYVDTSNRLTFGDYADEWLSSRVCRDSTLARVESHLRVHLLPRLGNRPLVQIRHGEIQAIIKTLTTTLSPGSVDNVYRTVSAIFAAAMRDRVIGLDPCQGVELPRKPRVEVIPPSSEQVASLLEAMPARYRIAGVLAAHAGLRQGEVLGLTVDRVDFLRRCLRIDRQMVTPPRGAPHHAALKSDSAMRTIPLPDAFLEALSVHVKTYHVAPGALLVCQEDGRPIRRNAWGGMWRRTAQRAGLSFRYHDLRHHYASVLLAGGCGVVEVQRQLGHASAKVTLDCYGHLMPDAEDRARRVVGDAMRAFGDSFVATGVATKSPG